MDGLAEQIVGEPSLGATHDVDQCVAWGADRLAGTFDGEATGTEDDIVTYTTTAAFQADREAAVAALGRLRGIAKRRQAARRPS